MRNAYLMGAALIALLPIAAQAQPKTVSKQVYQLHQKLITLDSHLDTPASLDLPDWSIDEEHGVHSDYTQVDLPRMKKGGLDGGFWAIYTGQGPLTIEGFRKARDFALLRGMSIRSMVAADPDNFTLALEAKDAAPIAAWPSSPASPGLSPLVTTALLYWGTNHESFIRAKRLFDKRAPNHLPRR